ncbi:unnamed protein product [Brassicogethes aeneus]|uniref:DUF4371 domain-containing protein n=1 Tax=Brassicogethes aeneus TaxID=1431903 RepID=A0A9P0FLR9_BRAAE|nr:unnamed protein product [Brassicogethes aeneus]
MSGYRNKFSGGEYRKRKAEESTKIDNLLEKIPKISSFMTSSRTVELLAEFDPFLSEHLKLYAHPGSGNTSYLSKTIYEETILLIQNKVLRQISSEVQSTKYFGVFVDSTPDIAHIDQLTIIIRYVRVNGERFSEFLPNIGHKAKYIEDALLKSLENNGLDIMNCRGNLMIMQVICQAFRHESKQLI